MKSLREIFCQTFFKIFFPRTFKKKVKNFFNENSKKKISSINFKSERIKYDEIEEPLPPLRVRDRKKLVLTPSPGQVRVSLTFNIEGFPKIMFQTKSKV